MSDDLSTFCMENNMTAPNATAEGFVACQLNDVSERIGTYELTIVVEQNQVLLTVRRRSKLSLNRPPPLPPGHQLLLLLTISELSCPFYCGAEDLAEQRVRLMLPWVVVFMSYQNVSIPTLVHL